MTKGERVLIGFAVGSLALAAACRFALPGIRFTANLSVVLAVVCALSVPLGRWANKSRWGRAVRRVVLLGLACLLSSFLLVEGLLVSRGSEDWSALPADAVIVLGAGVNGETPSLVLQSRIDAAAAYLAAHPDVPAVLSGGQGAGESITEAEAMRRALTAMGVEKERLLLEDRSTSTAENFAFSRETLEAAGMDTDTAVIAVVTNDFHQFRAHLLAQRAGLTTHGVPAKLPWRWLSANYYIREYFALIKAVLFD